MTGLVIGKTGQVSRCLQQLPLEADYLDRQTLDLAETDSIQRILEERSPDFIVNAAAYTAVDKAETEESLASRINGAAVGAIGRAAANFDVPLIHISTDYVFPGTGTDAYCEDDAVDPVNAYGRSKLLGEEAIEQAPGACSWTLRTSWVFSEFGGNFVKTMIRLAASGMDPLRVVGDQVGCPTDAGDIARVVAEILTRHQAGHPIPPGLYHCTSSNPTHWAGFAEEIVRQAQSLKLIERAPAVQAITTEEYPTPAKRPMNSMLDTRKLQKALGADAPDWRQGLQRVLVALKAEATGAA